jgi:glutathione S-transferase
MTTSTVFRVFGIDQSFFTRKITGCLDHKRLHWTYQRAGGVPPALAARGFPGGIPAVETPEGELMWDTTAMILYLDQRVPEPPTMPSDPVLQFLCFLIDDICDEWIYRTAVGSRWFIEENTRLGGYELGRDMTFQLPVSADQAHAMTAAFVRSSCGPLGVSGDNIQSWVDEVLRPWMRVLGAHLAESATPYLFGARPSLADFAVFGGSAAHFANDPACRRWMDEDAPALVRHTHHILEPYDREFGAWLAPGDVPDTLIAILADAGRLYLPWVSAATTRGDAEVVFASGQRSAIRATDFLRDARAVLLARYRALRSDALDAILQRAGILQYFAPHLGQAGTVPTFDTPPRPRHNRPYPPEGER